MPPSLSRRPFAKVIDGLKSKGHSVAVHTGMSICLVDFMASSPIDWLPSSPSRLSSVLLHKRKARPRFSCKDSPSPISPEENKSRLYMFSPAVTSSSLIDQASQSTSLHPSRSKMKQEEDSCEPLVSTVKTMASKVLSGGGKWCHTAKLALLLVVLFAFLSIGKVAAFGITSFTFLLLQLVWNLRLRVITRSCLASLIILFYPVKRKDGDGDKVFRKKGAMEGKKNITHCNNEVKLSIKIPCEKSSSLTISAPSSPTKSRSPNSLVTGAPTKSRSPNSLVTCEPPFSVRGSHVSKFKYTESLSQYFTGAQICSVSRESRQQTGSLDSKQQSSTLGCTGVRKIGQLKPQVGKNEGGSGCRSIGAAAFVILACLLSGRLLAIVGFLCWILLVGKLRKRNVEQQFRGG